jgi:hypothetical protein
MDSVSICNEYGVMFLAEPPEDESDFLVVQRVFTWLLQDQYDIDTSQPSEAWQEFED